MYGSWWDRDPIMKNFRFNTICNITQKPKELQRYNRACRFIGKCAVIKYQLLSKASSVIRKLLFDQLEQTPSIPSLNASVFYFHWPQGQNTVNYDFSTLFKLDPIRTQGVFPILLQYIEDQRGDSIFLVSFHGVVDRFILDFSLFTVFSSLSKIINYLIRPWCCYATRHYKVNFKWD